MSISWFVIMFHSNTMFLDVYCIKELEVPLYYHVFGHAQWQHKFLDFMFYSFFEVSLSTTLPAWYMSIVINHSVQLHIKGPWYYYLIPSLHPGASLYFVKVFGHLDQFTDDQGKIFY